MYDQCEAMNFGSAETKLKQLQLKLRESEQARGKLIQDNSAL
jgi:hypothetical protein